MSNHIARPLRSLLIVSLLLTGCQNVREARQVVRPESRAINYRPSEALPYEPLPSFAPPRTVSQPDNGQAPLNLSLDEAIRIALGNSEVIRVLTGFTAVSSGQTIYDPGIANAAIDQARGRFDPNLSVNNTFSKNDQANGVFTPGFPGASIVGSSTDAYVLDGTLSDTNSLGGTASARVGVTQSNLSPGLAPLDPLTNHFTELSYVQPLLQGGGVRANLAPVIIAGIDTERSFFQFKGSVQEQVRGVIEGYWALVFARTDRWARRQQVAQATEAYDREQARQKRGLADLGDVSQTRVALANFRANLVAAESNVLQREAALLSIMGISPTDAGEVIPITPPYKDRLEFEWTELVSLSERYRPDLVELKLIIEADLQRVAQAENNAQPRLDAVGSYRWDGLNGRTPGGTSIGTNGAAYTDWTLGVNFSVPLGLRQGRATVRQQELRVRRDRANLDQGLQTAVQRLALNVRNQDQFYEQYEAFLETREAAHNNLSVQQSEFENDRVIFLNLLQAITDWGNSVSAEAQSLNQYNTELANLELATGTILEAHGVRFMQERGGFAGPLLLDTAYYPTAITPTANTARYPVGDEPAEESFNLENPRDRVKRKPPVQPDGLEDGVPAPPDAPEQPNTDPPLDLGENIQTFPDQLFIP